MRSKELVTVDGKVAEGASLRFWEIGDHRVVADELLQFLKIALSTEQLPFHIHHTGAVKYAVPAMVVFRDSYSLDYYFCVMRDLMSVVMPGYAYSPLLNLFPVCLQQHPWLRYCAFTDPNASLPAVPMLEAEVFNDFVQMLRTRAREQNTVQRMRKWKGETESSHAAAIGEYVPELLGGGEAVEPIRLDFQFYESVFSLRDAMPYYQWIIDDSGQWAHVPAQAACASAHPESRARIDPGVAMQDRKRFLANFYRGRDREVLQYIRGYIIKMERGPDGAHHFHCCFFVNAKRPASLTMNAVINVLSQRWIRVTDGRGFVFNCHDPEYRKKLERQGRWVLGLLTGADKHRVKRFTNYLVTYFAREKEQSIHIKPTANSRVLTMAVGRETGQVS